MIIGSTSCGSGSMSSIPGQTGTGNVGGGVVKIRVLVGKPLRARREPKIKLNPHNCGVDATI